MAKDFIIDLKINCNKTVLTSETQVHKTERFVRYTKRFLNIDKFVSKVAESIVYNFDKISKAFKISNSNSCFAVQTQDSNHILLMKFGSQLQNRKIGAKDIVFCLYVNKGDNVIRHNDRTLMQYMDKDFFYVQFFAAKSNVEENDFKKLYNLSNNNYVNLPLLNSRQEQIIKTEDSNVLVQGVAGSGKTNICVNKIVYTAARAYYGKVLYTTFSRGLLSDTKQKVDTYKNNLVEFVKAYEEGDIIFLDANRKKAIENKLGIYFSDDTDENIIEKVKSIVDFLQNKVDYYLLEDIYSKQPKKSIVGENYFVKHYTQNTKNHQLVGKLRQIEYLSKEIIYKEIFGMISGCANPSMPDKVLSLEEYIKRRKDSFSKKECEIIYTIMQDYYKHLDKEGLLDNNIISRRLLKKLEEIELYSLVIVDEVQDMTEINLYLLKNIARKLFCVGDAMQMINPTYFSFAYLKRLMYEKDVVNVAELSNNYRNTKKIAQLVDKLGVINIQYFGTHSFVLRGTPIDDGEHTNSVYVKETRFVDNIKQENFYDITVVVADNKEKEKLKKMLKTQEILTVSEIKGLERDTIILYNILSANIQKWLAFDRILINRKKADENSVFRYYFNLLYVGLSRAKSNIFVVEEKNVKVFDNFFEEEFEKLSAPDAIKKLGEVASKVEIEEGELIERIEQFIKLEQYDNARFTADKILNDSERLAYLFEIEIYEKYLHKGKNREAGIKYWEKGLLEKAKQQFEISEDNILIELINACDNKNNTKLDVDIIEYFEEVKNNELAKSIIVETVAADLQTMKNTQSQINSKMKRVKEI